MYLLLLGYPLDQPGTVIRQDQRIVANRDPQFIWLFLVVIAGLAARRRQVQVEHGDMAEYRGHQQERHQHHHQVHKRGDIQFHRRVFVANYPFTYRHDD